MHNKGEIMKKAFALLMVLVMGFVLCFDTTAIYAKDKSLKELNKEIAQKEKELKEGKEKEKSMASQIGSLEEKIDELTGAIAAGEKKLDKLEIELEKAQKKVDTQNENLGGRLRNMYKNGTVGFMDVLLQSGSFTEFLTNLDLVEKIYASDKKTLENLQKAHDEIEKKKEEVEALQADLKASKQTKQEEMNSIAAAKKEIAKDNKELAKMLDEMEAEAEQLAAQLPSRTSGGSYSGGSMAWPTPGYTTITSSYGWRICPFHGREFHAGIDIGAPTGANVVAAAGGTVILAGYNGGFGNSVIIDHGGNRTTWYNHLSAIYVSYGSHVKKGQSIGAVGATGYATGPHLDYRVYNGSSPANPMSYY